MTPRNHAAGNTERRAAASAWETAIQNLADHAATHREVALSAITAHVHAMAEVVLARVAERGGDIDAETAALVEALREDVNVLLDRLIRTGGAA